MKLDDIKKRIQYLIEMGKKIQQEAKQTSSRYITETDFYGFCSTSLSFIEQVYGTSHSYYTEFRGETISKFMHKITKLEAWLGILESIRQEIEDGWLVNFKSLVSAEIFADFLEMAEYLLSEGYKDAAAVMIGSTLEEHLRQLCMRSSIDIEITNPTTGKVKPKTADGMNNDLGSAGVYEKLDQKNVTAWLDLRNKAAHGLYNEYVKEQVVLMCAGVRDFISRTRR